MTRRELLRTGGLWVAGLAAPRLGRSASLVEIRMRSDARGEHVGFDPIGILIQPGQTVRWITESPGNPYTTTSYHPRNGKHSLRIPEKKAEPWDSSFLLKEGDHFEVTLSVEGVYDYFCLPREAAGMVGRIVVGRPSGPGTLPFDYFTGRVGSADWLPVPEAARRSFPPIGAILRQRVIPHGGSLNGSRRSGRAG
jgi:plastocyanin